MLERQEIDALLISALYGELSPAEETRLAAHLEAHPTDKSALAALTSTREAVRESRILQVQLDPPQQISALLMQEAARRAPKAEEKEGWFARLARSFMMHPAMAAAAMLVVVIGVATMVKNRKGDHFAETESVSSPQVATPTGAADKPEFERSKDRAEGGNATADQGMAWSAGSGSAAVATDNYQVQLADGTISDAGIAREFDGKKPTEKLDEQANVRRQIAQAEAAKNEAATKRYRNADDDALGGDQLEAKKKAKGAATTTTGPSGPSGKFMEVNPPPEPMPKDLDSETTSAAPRIDSTATINSDLAKTQVNAITPGPSTPPRAGVVGAGSASNGYAPPPPTSTTTTGSAAKSRPNPDPKPVTTTPAPANTNSNVATNAPRGNAAGGGGAPGSAQAPARNTAPQQQPTQPSPPPPPPPAKVGEATRDGRAPATDRKAIAPAEDKATNDPALAWAREQHTAIIARVRAGDCKGAANLAVNLANRDRAYYQQNVATDRSVKECLAYIDNARERDAEQRADRAKASQQKRAEPAKRTDSKASKPAADTATTKASE